MDAMETGSEIPRPSLDEPHFDEDRTLQEARPVVPLQVIEAANHRRFAFRLVGAFVVAVILGAVTALVSIRLKQTPTITAGETVAIADDKLDDAETEVTELDDPVAEEEKPASITQRRPVVRPFKPVHQIQTTPEPAAEVDLDNVKEPQPILLDQWEERRLRRVMRRDRNERRSKRSRDLVRIDELFEGERPNN